MSQTAGCQPSPLIEAIFYRLPYFTSGLASNDTIENILDDLVRAAGWAAILIGIVIVLSICTCFYCCCTSFLCCVRGREKPLVVKLLLGVVTGAIIVVGIIIMFVLFWAESSLHGGIAGQVTEILGVVNNATELSPSVYQLMSNVIRVDGTRHSLFIAYFVILLFFLLAVLAVVALAPVCKSGIGVIIAVIIVGFFTVFNGILVASAFAVIVIYTDNCLQLFQLNVIFLICDDNGTIANFYASNQVILTWLDYLDVFCNRSVNFGFTLFILSAVLVILFILIEIFGIAYGVSFFGKKRESVAMNIMEDSGTDMTVLGPSYTSKDDVPLTNVMEYQ